MAASLPTLLIDAENLSEGDVLMLPFNRIATVRNQPKVGRTFVTFSTEFGLTRLTIGEQVSVQARVA